MIAQFYLKHKYLLIDYFIKQGLKVNPGRRLISLKNKGEWGFYYIFFHLEHGENRLEQHHNTLSVA